MHLFLFFKNANGNSTSLSYVTFRHFFPFSLSPSLSYTLPLLLHSRQHTHINTFAWRCIQDVLSLYCFSWFYVYSSITTASRSTSFAPSSELCTFFRFLECPFFLGCVSFWWWWGLGLNLCFWRLEFRLFSSFNRPYCCYKLIHCFIYTDSWFLDDVVDTVCLFV